MMIMIESETEDYRELEHILRTGGFEARFQEFSQVLVKPNLVHLRMPETGTITHPDSLRAVLRFLTSFYTGKIIVGDSPSYFEQDMDALFRMAQLDVLSQEFPYVQFVNLRQYPHKPVSFKGQYLEEICLPEGIEEWGIINLAKMKAHWITGMTAAVKNLVGLLQNPRVIHDIPAYRQNIEIHERIADLYMSIKDKIVVNVVDGIVGMQDGQVNGTTIYPRRLFVGKNAVEIDMRVRDCLGLPEGTPRYLEILSTHRTNKP